MGKKGGHKMKAIRTGYIQHETKKAILIEVNSGDMRGTLNDVWLPKSQIEIHRKEIDGIIDYVIIVPEWLNRKNNLGADDVQWLGIDLAEYIQL